MSPAPDNSCPPVSDANELWKRQRSLQVSSECYNDPSHDWNNIENARRYAKEILGQYDDRVQTTLAGLDLRPEYLVLDIGSGPGTLAIPIARKVRHVTAVEPGAGMAAVLMEQCDTEGLANVTCVKKMWEDIDPDRDLDGKYDIVIAALALTMADIREAVLKMDAVSKKYVCLYWFVDMPFGERISVDLWEKLHGTAYYPGPKTDLLYQVLYEAGIYANVEIFPFDKAYRFLSRNEMQEFFRHRFEITTPGQEEILFRYLEQFVTTDGDEIVVGLRSHYAKIWWEKK